MASVSIQVEISSSGKWVRLLRPVTMQGYTIPAGFVTDLDSIRRIPLLYALLKDRARIPAVMHDYLYTQGVKRELADQLFLAEMQRQGVHLLYCYPIYWGVRLFGKYWYDRGRHRH